MREFAEDMAGKRDHNRAKWAAALHQTLHMEDRFHVSDTWQSFLLAIHHVGHHHPGYSIISDPHCSRAGLV